MIPREPRDAREVCDILSIQHLAVAYADAVSRGDIAEACLTYANDGELHSPTTEPAIGRYAVTKTIATTCATLDFVFQTVHQGLVQVDGDTARARFPDHRMGQARRRFAADAVPWHLRGRMRSNAAGLAIFPTHVGTAGSRSARRSGRTCRRTHGVDHMGLING